jgi:hypothetical protein
MKKFVSLLIDAPSCKPSEATPFVFATYKELVKLSGLPARGIYERNTVIANYVSFVTESSPKELVQLISFENANDVKLLKWYVVTPGKWGFDAAPGVVRHFTEWLMISLSRPEVVETQEVKAQNVSIDVKKLDEEINRLFAMTTPDCKTVCTLYDIVQPVAESFKKLQSLVEYHSLLQSAENVKSAASSSKVGYDEEPDEYVCKKV